MSLRPPVSPAASPRPPLFALLFIAMFGFIGLTVIIGLWTSEGFHEPPLFFKVFGSLIGLAFIFVGFGIPLRALFGPRDTDLENGPDRPASGRDYKRPSCGAGLGSQEVSLPVT